MRFRTTGSLTVGGVTQEIDLPVEMKVADGTLRLPAQTLLKIVGFQE